MKFLALLPAVALTVTASAQVPKPFAGLFEKDVPVKGQIGVPMPPPAIEKYIAKVEAAVQQDPKWFKEYSAAAKPNEPLPYHEKIGLTKEEYDEYLKLWSQREFRQIGEDVMLLLRQKSADNWTLTATQNASPISLLTYSAKDDTFQSVNGTLVKGDDIKTEPESILGAWTGSEWKFEQETTLGKTRENIAFGKFADGKYGLVVYRFVEVSSEGTKLADKSIVVRFLLGKPAAPAAPKSPAPTKTPAPKKK
jgi:hypothetical protein